MKEISQRLWNKRLIELANTYMIVITCQKCGSPCNQGYVCFFCDDIEPSEPKKGKKQYEILRHKV